MDTLRDLVAKVGDVTSAKILDQCIVFETTNPIITTYPVAHRTECVECNNIDNFKNLLLNPSEVVIYANINRRLICRLFILSEYAPMFHCLYTIKGIYIEEHGYRGFCILNKCSLCDYNDETPYIRIDINRFYDLLSKWIEKNN